MFAVSSYVTLTLSVNSPSKLYAKVSQTLTFWNEILVESAVRDSAFKQEDYSTEILLAEFLSPWANVACWPHLPVQPKIIKNNTTFFSN